jgi:hypothetical protein
MKKIIFIMLFFALCANAFAQNPSYEKKLYYTCKVWGYLKYFHSEVSTCKVNWDSVLATTLPVIKSAESNTAFNDALLNMIEAAGPMEPATTPAPDELPPELKINLNLDWFNDPLLRADVKTILENIKTNFRPHSNCYVNHDGVTGYGWLAFPKDDPFINENLSENFPNEFPRLAIMFRYWNIIRYFNPYNNILETPWDSTLIRNVINFATVPDYAVFVKAIKKMSSKLDDAHAEGLTWSREIFPRSQPKLILRYTESGYTIVKSDISEIQVGDVLLSIDGKAPSQIEDSLRPYISAGNPNVFRRFIARYLLRGDLDSPIHIVYKDKDDVEHSFSTTRNIDAGDTWCADYYPCDSLKTVKWKKYDGNIGYVNMGILESWEAVSMYNSLYATKAIIFDVRNYPKGSISNIAKYIYPNYICFAKFTRPDVLYPGTYSWSESFYGNNNNPVAYKGKVIVLCNQETQSHAEFTCMGFQAMPDVVVVGSQTAGADGNISAFNMSKDIQVGFTTLGTFYPDGTETQRIGIVPDTVIYPTALGIRQGRDEVLDKAFEIARAAVSVDENEIAESDCSVFPNPASDYIEITTKPSEGFKPSEGSAINIYNIFGKKVMSVGTVRDLSVRIDISDLPKGMYFVKVGTETAKFVKM